MRRPHSITAGLAALLLATACAGTAQKAPGHGPVTGKPPRQALVNGAAIGKPRAGRSATASGGQQPGSHFLPARRCSSPRTAAEAADPLPCTPMLLVPVVLHSRHGQRRIIYIRKPCLCGAGG